MPQIEWYPCPTCGHLANGNKKLCRIGENPQGVFVWCKVCHNEIEVKKCETNIMKPIDNMAKSVI